MKIGDIYFYNNRRVEIVRIDTPEFVIVCADNNDYSDISGRDFCTACLGGNGMSSHNCNETQEIIDDINDESNEKDIFWVNIMYLRKKPVEYVQYEGIKQEIDVIRKDKSVLHTQKTDIEINLKNLRSERTRVWRKLKKSKQKLKDNSVEVRDRLKEKESIIEEIKSNEKLLENKELSVNNSELLRLLEKEIILDKLEAGGVDNWEWYGESYPEDNYLEEEKLSRFLSYKRL